MSLLTETFGPEVLYDDLETVKLLIRSLPPSLAEKRSYLLSDYAQIMGILLTKVDYDDIIEHA